MTQSSGPPETELGPRGGCVEVGTRQCFSSNQGDVDAAQVATSFKNLSRDIWEFPRNSGQELSLSDFFLTPESFRWAFKDHQGMCSGSSVPRVTPGASYREGGTYSLRNARSSIQGGAALPR